MDTEATSQPAIEVVTLTLNPAIDRTVTIPNFAAGKVNRVEQMQQNPGGKGVNVASILADFGHTVAVTGFLGRENSSSFEKLFAQKRIVDHFVRIAGETRVGIKISDPARQETTDINFPGQAPTPANLDTLFQRITELEGAWFVLAGILRAETMEQLFDYALAFAYQPLIPGNRIAIVTNAGGPGIICTDAAEHSGLAVSRFEPATIRRLQQELPPTANVFNPIDVIGDAKADRYEIALRAALADPNVDGAIVLDARIILQG